MAATHCLSCEHPNSAGAKFCEHCGSALNLRLCKKCEAINDAKAPRCHSCDAPLAPPRAVRKPRVLIALAGAGAVGIVCAAGALYLLDRTEKGAGPLSEKRVLTPFPLAPAAAERIEAAAPAPEPAAMEPAVKVKAAARTVTHTRAAPAAPEPERVAPAPARAVIAPAPAAPPVTHTRRAVATSETKTGSN